MMIETVLIALIGVLGTVSAGVASPLVKDRIDRRAKDRSERRRQIATTLLELSTISSRMCQLDSASLEWGRLNSEWRKEISRFELLVDTSDNDAPKMAEIAWVYTRRGGTAVEANLNPLMVSTAGDMLGRWYRGELRAKGMHRELLDFGEKMRFALVTGDLMPGGVPIPSDQLTEIELAERKAAESSDSS